MGTDQGEHPKRLSGVALVLGVALILASLLPRLQSLDEPLLDRYAFRQTQTALTVKTFLHNGIDLLNYDTPVFGPPWQVPFEFPLFQATAALISRSGFVHGSLDEVCRITGVLYFYLSALLLYAVCTLYLTRGTSLLAVVVYLWTPFNLIWSRACMIDYASVAFALGYLFATVRWLRQTHNPAWLVGGVVCGSLAGLVKVTTVPVVAVPMVFLVIAHGTKVWSGGERDTRPKCLLRTYWRELGGLVLLVAIPLAVSVLWIRHTDDIKTRSIFTLWLTSRALRDWNLGSWSQRFEIANWVAIARRIYQLMMPSGLVLMPIMALIGLPRLGREARVFLVSIGLGIGMTISIFFSLYVVHEYYLMAVAPGVAVLIGVGLSTTMTGGGRQSLPARSVLAVLLLGTTAKAVVSQGLDGARPDPAACRELVVARMIARVTGPNDVVILGEANQQWDPSIPYYADRRVFVLRDDGSDPRVVDFLTTNGFRFAALHLNHPARLRYWDKRLLAEGNEYRVYELQYCGPGEASRNRQSLDGAPHVCFSFSPGGDSAEFAPLHDVVIRPGPEGLVLNATGDDPFLLLPGFDLPSERTLVLHLDITSPSRTELKVYFTTASTPEFSEELSAKTELVPGRNQASVRIVHPSVVGRLRLDPGTCRGTYLLHSLQVVAETG